MVQKLPIFLHLFRNRVQCLTVPQLLHLLKPDFAPEGSNKRVQEGAVYAAFVTYIRQVASNNNLYSFLFTIIIKISN